MRTCLLDLNNYLNIAKMIIVWNRATQETFLKTRFNIFRSQKYIKKGYVEMTKKIYLEPLKKCPGSLCFTLLTLLLKAVKLFDQSSWKGLKLAYIQKFKTKDFQQLLRKTEKVTIYRWHVQVFMIEVQKIVRGHHQ